jgi:serine phosphatase RsbU (regulator of sigma subunit)
VTAPGHEQVRLPARRLLWWVAGGTLAGQVCNRLSGGDHLLALWLTACGLGIGWLASIRFLLLETRFRKFWIAWLAVAVLILVLLGRDPVGRPIAVVMTAAFLLLRAYAPYWLLTSAQRAQAFLLGLVCSIALFMGWDFGELERLSPLAAHGRNLALFFVLALGGFWLFSLIHLFLRMRLHFLRLKPKLAVSALFLAFVPLTLVVVFGLTALFGALGGSRATYGRDILYDWARLVDGDAALGHQIFPISFTATARGDDLRASGAKPSWLQVCLAALRESGIAAAGSTASRVVPATAAGAGTTRHDSTAESGDRETVIHLGQSEVGTENGSWSATDTTAYFFVDSELWLLRLRGVRTERLELAGYRIDQAVLERLAGLLRAGARLYKSDDLALDEDWPGSRPSAAGGAPDTATAGAASRAAATAGGGVEAENVTHRALLDLRGYYPLTTGKADSTDLWHRPLNFGASMLAVIRFEPQGWTRESVILALKVRLVDLAGEFIRGENVFNRVVLVGLGILALLFLFVQVVALFLGIRIATGITSAVQILHQGTRRLAQGDLGTRIDVPNEDEFGDLAASFNEMAAAIERGKQEAVAHERLERELLTAREIQQRLLPHKTPIVPGFEITGTSVPSRQVGGDYFDFLLLDDDRLGVAIGDVSGKGMPAALLMANLQASLHGQVIHPSSVADVVGRVNDLLVRSTDPHMFATFFYGLLDLRTATLTTTNAGHNPPLWLRRDGEVVRLHTGGLILGMLAGQVYRQQEVRLDPGDVVVLYTDGITEAIGPSENAARDESEDDDENPENMFGEEALIEVLRKHERQSAAGIKEAILSAVARHTAGKPQSDDVTLVVVKRRATA